MSQLSTTKLTLASQIEEYCPEHDEKYTNFCCATTCVKPLCPSCIENHYSHHKHLKIAPDIAAFKSVQNKCYAKIS